jgi:hypothetical protein
MKKVVFLTLVLCLMAALASSAKLETEVKVLVPEYDAAQQSCIVLTPPPIDALNRLVAAGILTQDIVDAVLELYCNPGDDLATNSVIWELIKSIGRLYVAARAAVQALKDAQAVSDWVCENFDDNGCGNGYHVPSFTGGGLQ